MDATNIPAATHTDCSPVLGHESLERGQTELEGFVPEDGRAW